MKHLHIVVFNTSMGKWRWRMECGSGIVLASSSCVYEGYQSLLDDFKQIADLIRNYRYRFDMGREGLFTLTEGGELTPMKKKGKKCGKKSCKC